MLGAREDFKLGDGRDHGCLIPCCVSIPSTAPSGNCVCIFLPSWSLCLVRRIVCKYVEDRTAGQGSVTKEHIGISY